MVASRTHYSTAEVAAQRGISPDKVLAWIASGELDAVNVATSLNGRPRWRISTEALARFDLRRSAVKPIKRVHRQRQRPAVIEFYA